MPLVSRKPSKMPLGGPGLRFSVLQRLLREKPCLGQPVLAANVDFSLSNNARHPNVLAIDPTRTKMLRQQFTNAILRRYRKVKAAVHMFLVEQDALGLGPKNVFSLNARRPTFRQYEFATNPDKLEAFRRWLLEELDAEVTTSLAGEWVAPAGSIATGPWTAKYIYTAYRKGRIAAYLEGRKAAGTLTDEQESFLQSAFAQPEMLAKVQLLATRSFEDLRGVNATMAAQMNRILAQGIADGRGVEAIAKEMANEIEGLSYRRALLIANTEIIHAHAEGQLDGFEALGASELRLVAEWVTAGDNRVCPRCAAMAGKTFKIAEARGVIPLHPSCRCSWSLTEKKK